MIKVTDEECGSVRAIAESEGRTIDTYDTAVSIVAHEMQRLSDAKAHWWSQIRSKYGLSTDKKYTLDFKSGEITEFVDTKWEIVK